MRRATTAAMVAVSQDVFWWRLMSIYRRLLCRAAFVTAAFSALFMVVVPPASPAPAFDSQGYVDSTARCTSPAQAVVFGSTGTSRVAICRSPDGDYQYRGVRVRDGAKLITSASRSSDGAFTAGNDGIEYMVTSSALVISAGERVIRDETMLDFHRPGLTTTTAPTTTVPTTTVPRTTVPTPTTPLPPPLPAEVGGS